MERTIFNGKYLGSLKDYNDLVEELDFMMLFIKLDIMEMNRMLKKRKKNSKLKYQIDIFKEKLDTFNYEIEPYIKDLKDAKNIKFESVNQDYLGSEEEHEIMCNLISDTLGNIQKVKNGYERLILGYKRLCL